MTQTKKRVWFWTGIIALSVVVTLAGIVLVWMVRIWFLVPHDKELNGFTDHFVTACDGNGLHISESCEFISGTHRSGFRDSTYFVSFRVPAEDEYLLFSGEEPVKSDIPSHDKLPDDGVEYVWKSNMCKSSWFMWLYRSDVEDDGYVYCYIECSRY